MASDAFRGIGTACVVLHVLLWLFVSAATIRGLCTGKLFDAPGLDTTRALDNVTATASDPEDGLRQPQQKLTTEPPA
jgi:hypothetical protein